MNIEIKKSTKSVNYNFAIKFLEDRVEQIRGKNGKELVWILEHNDVYTAGNNSKENEILNKRVNIIKTNRGGKITFHGPGQMICYFVIDLNKRKKDIRKFIDLIEKTIIKSLNHFSIKTFSDKKNIGIWHDKNGNIKKVAAIGIRVKKWVAYHGFAINITNDLTKYKNIIPCGIKERGVTNLYQIKNQNYDNLEEIIIKNFIKNLKT